MKNEKVSEQEETAEQVSEAFNAPPVSGETYYSLEEINATPSAFNVLPEVLAGALAMTKEKKLTRSQVLAAIEEFKNRKV